MKMNCFKSERGTILVIALVTITIMTLLCATSLYIASQNTNSAMQTASWQQALTGAESAVDQAINALNLNAQGSSSAWTNWKTQVASLPSTQPPAESPAPTSTDASGPPSSSSYNYLIPPAITLQGEGNNSVKSWVTIDTAGLPWDSNGQQWYRVRATGVANASALARVSNNKLDDNLRNTLSLHFNRKTGATITGTGANVPQVTRSIEVLLSPVGLSIWTRGVTLRKSLVMNGGGFIDSFDSSDPLKSTDSQYDITKRQSHGDVGIIDSTASTLNGNYLYGNLTYSGPAVGKTSNVQGTISTPFNATVPPVTAPTDWTTDSYSTALPAAVNNVITVQASGTSSSSPTRYKLSTIDLQGQTTMAIVSPTPPPGQSPTPTYLEIWVTGDLKMAGGSQITQASTAYVKYYFEGDINLTGNGYVNQGVAANLTIYGVSPADGSARNLKIAGGNALIAVVDAPAYDTTFSGSGDFMGALVANTLSVIGNGQVSLHYDEALNRTHSSSPVGNYAYASWFEDNSDPSRGIIY
jgi:hypothetical protein